MIETIRLFRKKEDDIWALFITEFFKFVGCIVCDCELHAKRVLSLKIDDEYDVNVFFGVSKEEMLEKTKYENSDQLFDGKKVCYRIPESCVLFREKVFATEFIGSDSKLKSFYTYAEKILRDIVGDIWKEMNEQQEVLQLCDLYCRHKLFFYLYNEGSRKFVKEQEYSFKVRRSIENTLQDTADKSYCYFKDAYNELYQKKYMERDDNWKENSPYNFYAEIVLMYKLNQKMTNVEKGNIFKIESLLEKIEDMTEKIPGFVRINYLAGSICKNSNEHYRLAERYFLKALKLIGEKNVVGASSFVYYRLGQLEEDTLENENVARICYRNAYHFNQEYYPAILKLAKSSSKYGIQFCKEVISIVLNGYEMNKVMPKQQVYAYEAFLIMGDIFREAEDYVSAEKCYNNAIKLAKVVSEFFVLFDANKQDGFYEIIRRSMPVEPIMYRLIRCATHTGDSKKMEEYCNEIRE